MLNSLLTLPAGNVSFDKISGTNTVQKILSAASVDSIKMIAVLYENAIVGYCGSDVGQNQVYTSQERVYSAHQLSKLISHPAMVEEVGWKEDVLRLLLATTLFEMKKPVGPLKVTPVSLSREAKSEMKDIFFKSLDVKAKSFESMCAILDKVLLFADDLLANPSVGDPRYPLTTKCQKRWTAMTEEVRKIRKMKNASKEDRVFQLLFIHMGLQMLSESGGDNVDTLTDLHSCYGRSKRQKKVEPTTGEPLWVEVVVDLLLSLLSQNKAVLRQVVNSVTAMICPHMTSTALQAVVDVVDEPEGETEADMTVKDEECESEQFSEDEDDVSDEEGEEDPDEDFKKKLKDALGDMADRSDEESIDMDDLDEEDMKKMDEALGQVFRKMSGKKSNVEVKKEREEAIAKMHFKIRALDIIDVYLAHQPPMSHLLYLILPLINAIGFAGKIKSYEPLQLRLRSTLKRLTNIKKAEVDDELDAQSIPQLLQTLVDISNSGTTLMSQLSQPRPLFAQCCTLVQKCAVQLNDRSIDAKIVEIYKKGLDDFFHKSHCQLPLAFFSLPIQASWPEGLKLYDIIAENAFATSTRPFRRIQATSLLSTLLKSPTVENADANLAEIIQNLGDRVLMSLKSYSQGAEMKPKFLCEVLNVVRSMQAVGADSRFSSWPELCEVLEKVREKIPKNRHFHDLKKAFNKACAPMKIMLIQGSEKRGRTTSAGESAAPKTNGFFDGLAVMVKPEEKKKKKKKPKSKESKQRRKEEKMHNLEGQFEGMEMPSFTGVTIHDDVNFGTVTQYYHEDETSPPKKKQKLKKHKKK